MCLCDLLMSSTLHYRKIYTHTNTHAVTHQGLSFKWTVGNICDQSFFLAPWVLRLHENLCQEGTLETLSLIRSVPFFSFFFCAALIFFFLYPGLITSYKHNPANTNVLDVMRMLHDGLIQQARVFYPGLCTICKLH